MSHEAQPPTAGCGQSLGEDVASAPAETAGRYHILEALRGGMGVVYFGHDRETDWPVAIKTFAPEYLDKPGARVRFLREAEHWIVLGCHPNIVRAHRVEQIGHPPQPYIVMDWIVPKEGMDEPSLRTRLINGRPVSFGRSLGYALDICRGMRYAQSKIPGLVHRDLKPSNILVGRDDLARVSDFGLARSYRGIDEAERQTTRTDSQKPGAGTAQYCAPEQWDIATVLDARADIYALGCILFELLTGYRAATGEEGDIRDIHLQGRLQPIPRALPEVIARLIRRCTAVDIEQRYPDWDALEQAISTAYGDVMGKPPRNTEYQQTSANAPVDHEQTYCALGRSYYDLGQWRPAHSCYMRALDLARNRPEPKADALHGLGAVNLQTGRVLEAVRYLQRSLACSRRIGDWSRQADALSTLGMARSRLSQTGRATRALRRALALAGRCQDRDVELVVLGNLANVYAESGQTQLAVACYEQMARDLNETASPDPAMELKALGNLGVALLELEEVQRAAEVLERAYILASESGDVVGQVHVLHSLCEALKRLGERSRLRQRASDYVDIAQKCGAKKELAHAESLLKDLNSSLDEASDQSPSPYPPP